MAFRQFEKGNRNRNGERRDGAEKKSLDLLTCIVQAFMLT